MHLSFHCANRGGKGFVGLGDRDHRFGKDLRLCFEFRESILVTYLFMCECLEILLYGIHEGSNLRLRESDELGVRELREQPRSFGCSFAWVVRHDFSLFSMINLGKDGR
jgi:hypothetical protein